MEDPYRVPSGAQRYLLSEESYQELKSLQRMLRLMARIAYSEGDAIDSMITIRCAELHYVFQQISTQIGDALERSADESGTGAQHCLWQ